jgi:hypothetical protein
MIQNTQQPLAEIDLVLFRQLLGNPFQQSHNLSETKNETFLYYSKLNEVGEKLIQQIITCHQSISDFLRWFLGLGPNGTNLLFTTDNSKYQTLLYYNLAVTFLGEKTPTPWYFLKFVQLQINLAFSLGQTYRVAIEQGGMIGQLRPPKPVEWTIEGVNAFYLLMKNNPPKV